MHFHGVHAEVTRQDAQPERRKKPEKALTLQSLLLPKLGCNHCEEEVYWYLRRYLSLSRNRGLETDARLAVGKSIEQSAS